MLLWTLLWGCSPAPDTPPGGASDAVEHLVRASVAMRGLRPREADVQAVRDDAEQLPIVLRSWLDDDAFGAAVRDHHAETLHLRGHVVGKLPAVGPLQGVPSSQLDAALDEAPLRLVDDIVRSGRPYTEIVTTDRTFTNDLTAVAHGLPYDASGPEWQSVAWPDGRPAAGLLADTAVLQRYQSSLSNHHRGRGALVLSAFLCDGVLESSVEAGEPPEIGEPLEDRVRTDPACTRCHASLDPVSSAFWGFDRYILSKDVNLAYQRGCPEGAPCYPLPFWRPEEAGQHVEAGMPDPSLKGVAVDGLEGLGRALAADPSFATCTARRFHGWHTGRHPRDVPDDVADELAEVLVNHGFDARELVVASLLHDDFQAAPARSVRPEELARTIEALTGYTWEGELGAAVGTVDLATNAEHGFRALLGGTDGWDLLDPTRTSTPSQALALEWLAHEAAAHAVEVESALPPGARHLFAVAPPAEVDESSARAQLVHLHEVVLQQFLAPDSADIDAAYELLRTLEGQLPSDQAWAGVLAALLQHDRMVIL